MVTIRQLNEIVPANARRNDELEALLNNTTEGNYSDDCKTLGRQYYLIGQANLTRNDHKISSITPHEPHVYDHNGFALTDVNLIQDFNNSTSSDNIRDEYLNIVHESGLIYSPVFVPVLRTLIRAIISHSHRHGSYDAIRQALTDIVSNPGASKVAALSVINLLAYAFPLVYSPEVKVANICQFLSYVCNDITLLNSPQSIVREWELTRFCRQMANIMFVGVSNQLYNGVEYIIGHYPVTCAMVSAGSTALTMTALGINPVDLASNPNLMWLVSPTLRYGSMVSRQVINVFRGDEPVPRWLLAICNYFANHNY